MTSLMSVVVDKNLTYPPPQTRRDGTYFVSLQTWFDDRSRDHRRSSTQAPLDATQLADETRRYFRRWFV